MKGQDIGEFFTAYQENRKLRDLIDRAFSDTPFSNRTGEMLEILNGAKTSRRIYLDTLRRFGRRDGLEIYDILKSRVKDL